MTNIQRIRARLGRVNRIANRKALAPHEIQLARLLRSSMFSRLNRMRNAR